MISGNGKFTTKGLKIYDIYGDAVPLRTTFEIRAHGKSLDLLFDVRVYIKYSYVKSVPSGHLSLNEVSSLF